MKLEIGRVPLRCVTGSGGRTHVELLVSQVFALTKLPLGMVSWRFGPVFAIHLTDLEVSTK